MKKIILFTALLPIFVLTACNESEEAKQKSKSEVAPKERGCKFMCGKKMPEFTTPPRKDYYSKD
jgi:hypothetical protein